MPRKIYKPEEIVAKLRQAERPRRLIALSRCLLAAAMFVLGWPAVVAAQTITEYPIPTVESQPLWITSGPDGALWFTEDTGNKIGQITVLGAITEFPIPTANSFPQGITAGPDGALWFTEEGGNKIGRITTAGTVTEFPIPTFGSGPTAITSGSDGALWFTESGPSGAIPNKIGRITTVGAVTEFALPTNNSGPTGITDGADGALWFTEQNGNQIGRITVAGSITEYPTPTANSAPTGITSGPDGALWFTEQNGNQIGRITTVGAITEFPIQTTNGVPYGIAAGSDGALWFTEYHGNKIGRITTVGAITEFPIPTTNSAPYGIAVGPDGALWFTEGSGNNIGRITTGALTITEAGTGGGQVTSNPAGIACGGNSDQCSAIFILGTPVALTASASPGSVFSGWSGGGCSGTSPCMLTLGTDTAVTATFAALPSYTLSVESAGTGSGMVTSNPSGINCGATCSASFYSGEQVTLTAVAATGSTFAGWSGGGCVGIDPCAVTLTANTALTASFVQNSATSIALQAAVLPLSRSIEVGATATAFATILNAGPGTASTCTIAPATMIPASFAFQTTDPTTNALTGTANTTADIAQGAGQSFVIAFTPTAAFAPTSILLTFGCANANPAPQIVGIDTLNLSASATLVPDIVALAASSDPGYVDIPSATGTGDFAVATINLGSTAQITVSANTGTSNLPVTVLVCQTNATSGACLATPAINVTTMITANATSTFGVFVAGSAAVPDSPGVNRVFVTFTDANGLLRGETSVAVRTQ
jgi:virginiamycin B lyase